FGAKTAAKDKQPVHYDYAAYAADPAIRAEILTAVRAKGIPYQETRSSDWNWYMILNLVANLAFPIFLLIMMMRMFGRDGQNPLSKFIGGKAHEFNKGTAVTTRFSDVAGIPEVVEEVSDIVEFLKNPKRFTSLGGRIPNGVLLMGEPGTGKTLLARALAGESGVPFFSISGSDFVEMFVGVGAARVRDLFETGKKNAPCIIFIDEIDAVGRSRGIGAKQGGNDEREQTLNQILVEMSGFEHNTGVMVIAATNRPDVLDPALLRPGRFDRRVMVHPPDVKGREDILKVHARKILLDAEVDLAAVARGTAGLTGADLENLLNEAALIAGKANKPAVGPADLEAAESKVTLGSERKGALLTEKEKRSTAVHEAGHTLTAWLTPDCDPIGKVSIIPRGRAMGVTVSTPSEEKQRSLWRRENIAYVKHCLGGRVAEKVVFDDVSTGAASDLVQATDRVRRMVCNWGMSDKLGPLAYGTSEGLVIPIRDFSEATAAAIDAEIKRIVEECQANVRDLLTENRPLLEKLAAALIEHETLKARDIERILGCPQAPPTSLK
ncbi:MAG: ATP-dependent zinc metalloprotease FtsH, partial [Patescibacteria group bacterium]